MSSIGQEPQQTTKTESAHFTGKAGNEPIDYSDKSVKRGYSSDNSYSRAQQDADVKTPIPKPQLDSPSETAESNSAQNEVVQEENLPFKDVLGHGNKERLKKALVKGVEIADVETVNTGKNAVKEGSTTKEGSAANTGSPITTPTTANKNIDKTADTKTVDNALKTFDKFSETFKDVYIKMGSISEIPPDLKTEIEADYKSFMQKTLNDKQPLDMDSATTMLVAIQAKLQDNRIKFDQETIKTRQVEYEQQITGSINKIRESIQEAKDAKDSGAISKIFGWIAVVAMVIVTAVIAVIGAVFTGGVLTAVAVGLMVAALAIVLTMQVSQEVGSTWMMDMFGDSEDAKIGAMVFWSTLIIALSIGGAAASGMAGAGASAAATASNATNAASTGAGAAAAGSSATSAGSTGASVTATAANSTATATNATSKAMSTLTNIKRMMQVISGGAMMGDGAATVVSSVHKYNAEDLRAEAMEDRAFALRVQQQIDDAIEAIGAVIEELQAGYKVATDIIKANHETKSTLARNLRA